MLNNISKVYIPYYLPNDKLQSRLDLYENYTGFNTRFFHRQRINTFLKIIKSIPRTNKALDAGCGTGIYTDLLSCFSSKTYMIDIKKHTNPEKKRSFIRMDLQATGFKDNSFDFIVCSEVLEHIPDISRGLAEIYRILQHDGMLLISMPNALSALWLKNRISFTLTHLFKKTFTPAEVEYKKHMEFTKSKIIRLVRKTGFKIRGLFGVFIIPFPPKFLGYLAYRFPKLAYKICKLDSFFTKSRIKGYSNYLFVLGYKK